MPSQKRNAVSAALIGAATAALTVKGAMASAIAPVAQEPLADARMKLAQASQTAAAASANLLQQAPATIGGAIVHASISPGAGSARAHRSSSSSSGVMPRTRSDDLQFDPEKRLNPSGSNRRALARRILHDAAVRHGLDPKLVLAVSYWESGWDQSRVSANDAVGLMQVEPYMADAAGPTLLGRTVDLSDPYDNADLGAAILKDDLNNYGDPVMALAAYYEGPTALRQNGLTADAQQYAQGVLALAAQMPD